MKLFHFIPLFCCLGSTLLLSAQQSCYEQYLREHDIPFLTTEDSTILADAQLAMVDSAWYMWLSVDPLADKNIANTPYMYCNGNPIMLVDPDGRFALESSDGDTNYKTILVLPTEQGMSRMKTEDKTAFRTTHKMATSQGIPTLFVDNAQDYVAAMEHGIQWDNGNKSVFKR